MADEKNQQDREIQYVERGASPALVGALVALVVLVLLIFANTKSTEVNFIFFKRHPQLWVLVVVTIAITLVAERLVLFAWRRRKKKKERDKN